MPYNHQHPFQQISGYNSFSMLESLIPFVDYSLKLPLALFIKFNEIKLIIQTFQNQDLLCQIGLHNESSKPTDMLYALTGIPPEVFDLLQNMSEKGNNVNPADLFSGLTNFSTNPIPNGFDQVSSMFSNTATANTSDIDDLFAAYDKEHSPPPPEKTSN
ncbi:MAG: hypothetical protein Q4D51_12815 [Eubacteriales bacterium]|nr:hypothetical protein [Eubacteriales bacterium]